MNKLLRFDNRVVVITGAGGGLGKAYAKLFAERGASVLINDYGSDPKGDRLNPIRSKKVAKFVVDELKENLGKKTKVVANTDSVLDGEAIIKAALDAFGRVDVIVNSAGIGRNGDFNVLSEQDWEAVHDVYIKGSYRVIRAAWDHFVQQKYGRIINTSSITGIFGAPGLANYCTATAGIIGLSKALAREGSHHNIHTNVIVPIAASRLTYLHLSQDMFINLKPEAVAPVVMWMAHEDFEENGAVIEAAAGMASKYSMFRSRSVRMISTLTEQLTPEKVVANWDKVIDMKHATHKKTAKEVIGSYSTNLKIISLGMNHGTVNKQKIIGYTPPISVFNYGPSDTAIYSLAVGMSWQDPHGLSFLFEDSKDHRILPTYPSVMGFPIMLELMAKFQFSLKDVLHGEQYDELLRPLPPFGPINLKSAIIDEIDKKVGTLYIVAVEGDDENGPIFKSEWQILEMGSGSYGGKRDTKKTIRRTVAPPRDDPVHATFEFKTSVDQAILYRFTGDVNPLHIDPSFAARAGYSTPILQGLCVYGIVARQILRHYADSDPTLFKCIKARFSKPVIPGQTLVTKTWLGKEEFSKRIYFETKLKETDEAVITGAYIDLNEFKMAENKPVNEVSTL